MAMSVVVRAIALLPVSLTLALVHTRAPAQPRSWDDALASFADKIEAKTHGMSEPTVVLSIAGGQHLSARFPEMLLHYKERAGLPLAVVAMDNETEGFFSSHGVVSMFFDLDSFDVKRHEQPKGWPSREAIMRGKYEVTSLLLDRGVTVVMSELDVYWKKNPLVLMTELSGDFLVTQHQYDRGGEVNVGFYIAKPTAAARRTFSGVRAWLNSESRGEHPCGGCFDQVLLDFAIRCSPKAKLVTKCHFPPQEQAIMCDSNSSEALRWSYIPWERLPHPPLHNRYEGNMTPEMQEFMTVLETTAVGVHLWSGYAHPKDQMAFAYDHGFWASGAAPPPSTSSRRLPALGGPGRLQKDGILLQVPCGCEDLPELP